MKANWRSYALTAATAAMESCWLLALLFLVNSLLIDSSFPVAYLWFFLPLAFVFNRLWQQPKLSRRYSYLANAALFLVVSLVTIKVMLYSTLHFFDSAWLLAIPKAITTVFSSFDPALLGFIGGAVFWASGWRLARHRATFPGIIAEFQFGLIALLIVIFSAAQFSVQITGIVPLAVLFFLFALPGMALARAEEGGDWLLSPNRGLWLGLLMGSLGIIVILGLFFSQLITPGSLETALNGFKWLWGMVLKGIDYLVSLLPPPDPVESLPMPAMPKLPEITPDMEREAIAGSSGSTVNIFRLIFNILSLALIVVAMWRISTMTIGWLRGKRITSSEAEVTSLPGAFKADLTALFRRIAGILLDFLSLLRLKRKSVSHSSGAITIRQIYREMLQWGTSNGRARPVFQTPYEYLTELEKFYPAGGSDFRFITDQYVRMRYGQLLPDEKELDRSKKSWYQLRSIKTSQHERR